MTDIIERLRELAPIIMDSATNPSDANTVEDAILEIAGLRAQLARANSPVVDCRNSHEGEHFRPAECGGFQGHED